MDDRLVNADVNEPVGAGDPALTAGELLRHAAAVSAILPEATPGSHVALVFGRDRAAFAAALLGTWAAGHAAAIAADTRRDLAGPVIDRPEVVTTLHDTGFGIGTDVPRFLGAGPPDREAIVPALPDQAQVLTAFRTSFDGALEATALTAAELRAEIAAAAAALELPPDGTVVSTLTPAFLPSLVLGLLVPLRARGRFDVATPRDIAATADHVRRSGAHTLVTVPAHLRELARAAPGALAPLARVVCVADPPDARAASMLAARHGIEVQLLRQERVCDGTEPRLLDRSDVADAACVTAPATADLPRRTLAAVVAPEGTLPELRATLEHGEVRCVDRLPRDANGELTAARLYRLFGLGRDGLPVTSAIAWDDPEVSTVDRTTTSLFHATVPEDYVFFEGHFPTYPMLAGAVQLHELILPCVRRLRPRLGELERLSAFKFLDRIGPGDRIALTLTTRSGSNDVSVTIAKGDKTCSTGRLGFAGEADASSQ